MTAVAVAVEVRVVFVQPHMSSAESLIASLGGTENDTFPRAILSQQISKCSALRRRILRMRVIVVESRAVRQHEVTLHVME